MLRDGGRSPCTWQDEAQHLPILQKVLAAGAKVNLASGPDADTSLMYAAYRGHVEAVSALLAAGADVELEDREGKKAKDYVAQGIRERDQKQCGGGAEGFQLGIRLNAALGVSVADEAVAGLDERV
jgi:hypothetical protein